MDKEILRSKISGSFVGAASGDVLGAAVEFKSKGEIIARYGAKGITDFDQGGPFGFKLGEVTDDTQQAILLAEALLEHDGTKEDFWKRFGDKLVKWRETAQDCGSQTGSGIRRYKEGKTFEEMLKWGPSTRPSNGAVMRVYPVAFMYFNQPEKLVRYTEYATAITHPHPEAIACALVLNTIIASNLYYHEQDVLLDNRYDQYLTWVNDFLSESMINKMKAVKNLIENEEPVYSHTLATEAMQVAFWANSSHWSGSFASAEQAIIKACSFGGDNDTHGAVAGALAGLKGIDELPRRWVTKILEIEHILELSDKFVELHS